MVSMITAQNQHIPSNIQSPESWKTITIDESKFRPLRSQQPHVHHHQSRPAQLPHIESLNRKQRQQRKRNVWFGKIKQRTTFTESCTRHFTCLPFSSLTKHSQVTTPLNSKHKHHREEPHSVFH